MKECGKIVELVGLALGWILVFSSAVGVYAHNGGEDPAVVTLMAATAGLSFILTTRNIK